MRTYCAAVVALFFVQMAFGAGREDLWKKVEDAMANGLPQTAITNLQPIIKGALADKAYAEAAKAVGRKVMLEAQVQGSRPDEAIRRYEAELRNAPEPLRPVLQSLLGHAFWNYYQQNRWVFLSRTATSQTPGDDFTAWDLPRLFSEMDKHFQGALAAERLLKATPIASWDDLLPKGTMPDALRPTLYDFLAYDALPFYTAGEQAGAKPQDTFELAADSPVFDGVEAFLAWRPEAGETNSPARRALALFQSLLQFHKNDPQPREAFAHANLERLRWGWNAAQGENKSTRYKAALEQFIRDQADSEQSAIAYSQLADVLRQESDLVAAHEAANRGYRLFPDSPGGKLCHNIVLEIESSLLQLDTEKVWNCLANSTNQACPKISIHYRNVKKAYFRAYRQEWEDFVGARNPRAGLGTPEQLKIILAEKPALEWSETLPPTADFLQKTFKVAAPRQLLPGFYLLAASSSPDFGEQVFAVYVWVSQLAVVMEEQSDQFQGIVVDSDSGVPLPGAKVRSWRADNMGRRAPGDSYETDTNGMFTVRGPGGSYAFLVSHGGSELGLENQGLMRPPQDQGRANFRTVFFLDRAIYRPGQTIQFKGICLVANQKTDQYEVIKDEDVVVSFRDPNGKEVATQKLKSNDYGSFAGVFTAPRDTLMGQVSLRATGRARGAVQFSVEEYKRPKFQVILEVPEKGAKLGEKVTLTGKATAYTGAAIDGAQVAFRVSRQVQWPIWRWWMPPQNEAAQEIANGTIKTDASGQFTVEFVARPAPGALEKEAPTFVFRVNADVTDTAGETRSDEQQLRIGFAALEAAIKVDDWQTGQKPVRFELSTSSLDGQPQLAEGSLKIFALEPPANVVRRPVDSVPMYYRGIRPAEPNEQDMSDYRNWAAGRMISEQGFTTGTNGQAEISAALSEGAYRAVLETRDRFGKPVKAESNFLVLAPAAQRLGIKVAHLLSSPSWKVQPGDEFTALWGTGYPYGRALVQVEHRGQVLQQYWTEPGKTQQPIKVAVTEQMRGGFVVQVKYVRENRAYLESRVVDVPWSNKQLKLTWERFVSKLQPGQPETWTLAIRPALPQAAGAEKLAAELVATLYDESLDAYQPHTWEHLDVFRRDYGFQRVWFQNRRENFQHRLGSGWTPPYETADITYRTFPPDLVSHGMLGILTRGFAGGGRGGRDMMMSLQVASRAVEAPAAAAFSVGESESAAVRQKGSAMPEPETGSPIPGGKPGSAPALGQVTARKNLNETAFFFPQLLADSNGVVRLNFTMPEALTRWRFLALAHDASLRSGFLEDHAVTAKELMVQPNPPRFLREGDTVEFTVKVSNQSEKPQHGLVRLNFRELLNDAPADQLLRLAPVGGKQSRALDQPFDIPSKQSQTYAWRLTVPDGCGFLAFKAVAASDTVSDGEEAAVPVLSRRILVTESLPLPIRGPATREFTLDKLLKSRGSKTLQHQALTLQMVSNPAWYAVLALPYLMEYPYECSEQLFNRFYANSLARTIALSDPKIRRVFEQWKNTPALESPLEKNQDLKSVMLEETPWVGEAAAETQARRNVGLLFDDNRLNSETARALEKLTELQMDNGLWSWFPGGQPNEYISLYIMAGFGRLGHLKVDVNVGPALRALDGLDAWMSQRHAQILKNGDPANYVPGATDALYLYGRSFFLKEKPVPDQNQAAVRFFLAQARTHWLKTGSRQTQAHLALALQRFARAENRNDTVPSAVLRSLKERSVTDPELGRYWRDTESWWWYEAPIETQALMIEAFDEVLKDSPAVEECRVWLLKQKQTKDWRTTKATADAVYALLLRGTDLLSSDALVQVRLGGQDVTPGAPTGSRRPAKETRKRSAVEPGTGFYEVRFGPGEIKANMGKVAVTKADQGVAWGGLHWQYLEDQSKVTPHQGTPLKLSKSLFVKRNTTRGPVLEPVKQSLQVGDELVVRIELRTDRDMEYVHMKDQRGSGTEPVNVLSQYRFQDGLGYYESTRDTASHYFIDYLPKGTHVFEYSTRVQLRGEYPSGVTLIECMYAPEFNSHSQSIPLIVR